MKQSALHLVIVLLAAGLVAGCATDQGARKRMDTGTAIANTLNDAAKPAPAKPSKAVNDALLPPMADSQAPAAAEQHFDLKVNNAEARAFFMGLVKGTRYNVVVQPQVSGKITLDLHDVTVPQVMDMVRDAYGYDYRRHGDNYLILPATLQTHIFQVNYLDIVRKGSSQTRVSSGQSTETPLNQTYAGGYGGGAYGGGNAGNGQNDEDRRSSSRIETKNDADFWANLKDTLNALVGPGDGHKVVINASTGVIVVRAMPSELRTVKEYLQSIQANAVREVVIEAKFIEVQLADGFQAGINWAALNHAGDTTITGGMVGGQNFLENGTSDLQGTPIRLEPGSVVQGFDSSAFGGAFALALNTNSFNAFLEALKTQGDTHVLSSPRVTALNNQKSVIKVGSDEFFVTGINSNTIAGTATNTNQNIQLTPFFSGIALDVTPQISEAGDILMHIHPSISEVTDQRKTIVFGGNQQELPLAYSTVRESDAIVRAKSGQIIIIGGLMKTSSEKNEAGVPLLSDLPILGNLFKYKKTSDKKSELVILLKPVVVDSDDDWRDLVQDPRDRLLGKPSEDRR